MKAILAALLLLAGCAGIQPLPRTPPLSPRLVVVQPQIVVPLPTGRVTTPPLGCVQGKKRGVEC